jgi:cytochrome c oxidase subunit 4
MSELRQTHEAHEQSHHVISQKTYWTIYVALLVLLVATVLASELPISRNAHLFVAMTIAVVKAVLIMLFFMHVYYSAPLTWITATGSLLWVALLLGFLLADYWSRDWLNILGK